ncbi:1-deoxy-D-xylulose-5-phosphate synthase [Aliikangiella coralliicola]|uniref:1-deoxy-D-xylulose-5-phosphate synthase n=1 Tax=Aliikangiella coralliicola TaxID=2592383 RepID=A0A545U831_9GAMM|nr:1-deoxy-D-xylulose-5-phosphate synthase [Aliikangiella coralliicola]TQV85563.1 1-deoxy-D-xylulose-5-phosphate synthase [Aliikangiella coralliicola]
MLCTPDKYPNLAHINLPEDLREQARSDLQTIVDELRAFLIESTSQCGGHFAAGLGTVELTVALHYLFDTPIDKIIWDVGHQAYPHKVLTGRKEELISIRQTDGLHPFPSRFESEYDCFGVGHSSTSISAALGMAVAAKASGDERRFVAVIGDGAMTAGMAFEALNHAADLDANLTVILNDNDMSISENVGGLNNYLAKVLSGKFYSSVKEGGKKVLQNMPTISEWAHRVEEHMKGMVLPGTLFEELGFNYIGPIDGHSLPTLLTTIGNIKALKGPQLLHVVTRKGKGFEPAEKDPIKYHAVPVFNPQDKELPQTKKKLTYSNVFGHWLCDMAAQDEMLMGITPAMREGSDLIAFSRQYPERYFDVGIAEQHAVTLAAGMACENAKPVCAIYGSFLQRAYDQLIHDVALQDLDVLFAIDRGGIVGGDGATHHGAFDLSYLRCIPNMVVMTPSDERECRLMLSTGYYHQGPAAVRYPRGAGVGVEAGDDLETIEIGKAVIRREGRDTVLLAFGSLLQVALEVAEEIDATVVDMRFVKPLDAAMITQMADMHQRMVTLEENVIAGGAGSAVGEFLNANGINISVLNLGLPDRFVEHGEPVDLLARCGLDKAGVLKAIKG